MKKGYGRTELVMFFLLARFFSCVISNQSSFKQSMLFHLTVLSKKSNFRWERRHEIGDSMNSDEYKEAKKRFEAIDRSLKNDNLSPEERKNLGKLHAQLAAVLLHPLIPADWGRRIIMILVFLIGLYGIVGGNPQSIWVWILLPLFSPRIVGKIAYAIGEILSKLLNNKGWKEFFFFSLTSDNPDMFPLDF